MSDAPHPPPGAWPAGTSRPAAGHGGAVDNAPGPPAPPPVLWLPDQDEPPPPAPGQPRAGGSWRRVDLAPVLDGTYEPPTPSVGRRDDGVGLFYPGRIHSVAGEPEALKTWFILTVTATELAAGHTVLYLDFEDEPGGIVSRLLSLGTAPGVIRERFCYVRPDGPLGPVDQVDLAGLAGPTVTLAVVDGVTEAMGLFGLKPKDDADTAAFGRRLPRFLAAHGPAVVQLDHVVKDRESRGRWATGSQHKLAGLNGAAYVMEAITPFSPGHAGKSRVRVAKDRPGQVRRHALPGSNGAMAWLADFTLSSESDGSVFAGIAAPVERDGPWRPTALMKRVSDALSAAPEPLSVRGVLDRVPGRQDAVRRALAALVDEGNVITAPGPRNAQLHVLAKPFTEGGTGAA